MDGWMGVWLAGWVDEWAIFLVSAEHLFSCIRISPLVRSPCGFAVPFHWSACLFVLQDSCQLAVDVSRKVSISLAWPFLLTGLFCHLIVFGYFFI